MTWVETIFWSLYALGSIATWAFFVAVIVRTLKSPHTWEGDGPVRKPGDSDRTPWYEAERKARGRQARGLR